MVQDALVDVLRAYTGCRAVSRPRLEAWLARVADREIAALFRREAAWARWCVSLPAVEEELTGSGPDARAPRDARLDPLARLLDELDPEMHVLLWLHVLEGASWGEVGAELGIPATAAKRRWQRLRDRFRRGAEAP